eukprot:CAMPEP_0172926182 /NCGR_PEP_ID=MMETSP1075-20121228/215144_1 /TAXON_ID=2916 /ORGANISM="Ceratium fusus, Strain PA161109" /LENGTH=50 /DNA_ID=CAMNT_0013787197 /DNA_START=151 /DNA_END=300 /DNA_ORIENTATION=-
MHKIATKNTFVHVPDDMDEEEQHSWHSAPGRLDREAPLSDGSNVQHEDQD